MTRLHLATANTPGAIALLQLHGTDAKRILQQLTRRDDWTPGHIALCNFADIDEGLAVVLDRNSDRIGQSPERKRRVALDAEETDLPVAHARGSDAGAQGSDKQTHDAGATNVWVQLMPHGGPRVVQRLIDHLITLGCTFEPTPDPRDTYPEANSAIEADMLRAIAAATSPAAIDLLAAQPTRWRHYITQSEAKRDAQRDALLQHARVLDRLIVPPTVVVVGRANVGKSTLTNALTGKATSIVADLPGTTRDWVGSLVELVPAGAMPTQSPEVAVHWLDTPGLRDSHDAVEQRAIALARSVIEKADVLIAMRDTQIDWPTATALPRTPDLWVVNKCDDINKCDAAMKTTTPTPAHDAGNSPDHPLRISATQGHALNQLQYRILHHLGLETLDDTLPWAFSPTLHAWASGESIDLDRYLQA